MVCLLQETSDGRQLSTLKSYILSIGLYPLSSQAAALAPEAMDANDVEPDTAPQPPGDTAVLQLTQALQLQLLTQPLQLSARAGCGWPFLVCMPARLPAFRPARLPACPPLGGKPSCTNAALVSLQQ